MREVAVGILRGDGKVLACQRRRNAVYPLKWEFPGGKVEAGESPAEALRREVSVEDIFSLTKIDPWFLNNIKAVSYTHLTLPTILLV